MRLIKRMLMGIGATATVGLLATLGAPGDHFLRKHLIALRDVRDVKGVFS
jgi:hypothetical protein